MLDIALSRAPWARSSNCPSTLLKKLFMATESDLLWRGQKEGKVSHTGHKDGPEDTTAFCPQHLELFDRSDEQGSAHSGWHPYLGLLGSRRVSSTWIPLTMTDWHSSPSNMLLRSCSMVSCLREGESE